MEIAILFIIGLAVGILSAFFGIGGGTLMVPTLYWLYPQMSSSQIISISLGTIFINSIVNSFRFLQLKLSPSLKTILIFFLTAVLGTGIGHFILNQMNTAVSKKLFAIVLIITILKLFLFDKLFNKQSNDAVNDNPIVMLISGLLGSFVAVITGLGGGIVYTPMFLTVAKMPAMYVSAYSNMAMCFASFIGIIPFLFKSTSTVIDIKTPMHDFFIGDVNFALITVLICGSWLSGRYGVMMNQKVDSKNKKAWFGFILSIFALKMFILE